MVLAGSAHSGDASHPYPIGFSGSADTFAFADFGIQDGSGFAYASVYVLDISRDQFAVAPIHLVDREYEKGALTVLGEALESARPQLERLNINTPARLVYSGKFEPPALNRTDAIEISWRDPTGPGMPRYTLTLTLTQYPLETQGCDESFGFSLASGGQLLQHDETLPGSRGCPRAYSLARIYIAETFPRS